MSSRTVRVAVIGAGLGGIATAVKLEKAGLEFTVFEASAGPGGVWYDNTYPGCEVDVASNVYSFSFLQYDWPRSHGTQPELQQYCEHVLDHFGLRSRFRFSTKVEEAVWDGEERVYHLRLENGEQQDFDLVVSAVGMLNVPNYPDWPGIDEFRGPLFHSARWEHEHDFRGKRIAVVGTGCTAAQVVPELAKVARHVYLFQREPGWVLPKHEYDYTPEQRARQMSRRWREKWKRLAGFRETARYLSGFEVNSKRHAQLTQMAVDYIESTIEDDELRKLVTPSYPYGCKRTIKSSNFYPTLNLPHVELVPKAVTRVTPTGLVDADGVEREVDVVVLAVGFRAADYLRNLRVVGRGGKSLRELWDGDPRAFVGLTVPGVPNFFMVYGPNTNGGGPITAQQERQAEAIVSVAKRMQRGGRTRVDTKDKSMQSFVRWIDKQNEQRWSAQAAGCHNYFFSSAGRNVTQWPMSHLRYMAMTRVGVRRGLTLER